MRLLDLWLILNPYGCYLLEFVILNSSYIKWISRVPFWIGFSKKSMYHYECSSFPSSLPFYRKWEGGSTPWPSGSGGENICNCHLVLWPRNHVYGALTWKDWFYYHSKASEFRYGFGKVLSTRNRPTHGLAFSHCVLCLNLNKGMFKIVFYTHTHTH